MNTQVIVRGNHHLHRIDGHTTVEVFDHDQKGRRLEGLLGVQVHVGAMKVQFKDWRLKDLPEAPLIPPEKTPIPPNAPKVPVQGAPQRRAMKKGLSSVARCLHHGMKGAA